MFLCSPKGLVNIYVVLMVTLGVTSVLHYVVVVPFRVRFATEDLDIARDFVSCVMFWRG